MAMIYVDSKAYYHCLFPVSSFLTLLECGVSRTKLCQNLHESLRRSNALIL